MPLNPDYVLAPSLQEFFIDKDSGLPMAGGKVFFFEDNARTIPKDVFEIAGTPPNYEYNVLPNPVILSAVGTFQDASGVDILPYYFPFDAEGNVQLYFIAVYNADNVLQFTREGFPNTNAEDIIIAEQDITNFIPNGQFLSHNNWISLTEPPFVQYSYPVSGAQTVNAQPIAQGGWNFIYTNGTTATFNNSFSQIPSSGGWNINSFPKFLFNFVCTSIGNTPPTRDLRIQWPDVNKFSSGSPPGSTPYTLFFDAKSNDSNTYIFQLIKVYYFGTGGSPSNPVEEFVTNVTIGPGNLAAHNINNIIFSVNLGTIGTNGDDYVALTLRGPTSNWNVAVSDFLLAPGTESFSSFPTQTNDQMLSRGVAGWMPTPDPTGLDLYLPLVLTPQGMIFDHSGIGEIVSSLLPVQFASSNLLPMNGASYLFSGYSSNGIPYSRLGNFLMTTFASYGPTDIYPIGNGLPLFGSGVTFINAYGVTSQPTQFLLHINAGAGVTPIPAVGTAPVTLTTSADPNFTFTLNSVPTAGEYFTFSAPVVSPQAYYVWFTVNGAGTDPMPGGTGLVVNIITADTTATIVIKILFAINHYMFATFNLVGYFLRCLDTTGAVDPDSNSRLLAGLNGQTGAFLGSTEGQAFLAHAHTGAVTVTGGPTAGGDHSTIFFQTQSTASSASFNFTTNNTGGNETRPINFAVDYFIRY